MKHRRYNALKVDGLIEHNGIIYQAEPQLKYRNTCIKCDLRFHFEACGQINCMRYQRPDKVGIVLRAVAFKEKKND